jgi:hypothetical protein
MSNKSELVMKIFAFIPGLHVEASSSGVSFLKYTNRIFRKGKFTRHPKERQKVTKDGLNELWSLSYFGGKRGLGS